MNHTQLEVLLARCIQYLPLAFKVFHQTSVDTAREQQRDKGNRHSAPFTLTTTKPALRLWRNLHATSPSHQQMRAGPMASHKSCRKYTGTLALKESGSILNCQQGGQVL